MKKKITQPFGLVIVLSLFVSPIFAQYDFTKADANAKNITEEDIELTNLAKQLTQNLTTEAEKARAIYMWLAGNIRYDCKKYHKRNTPKFSAYTEEELAKKITTYHQKNLIRVLDRRRGVCEDYSRLFNALCQEIGLESVQIVGNARDFHKPYRKTLGEPHAWNGVKIEGKWYLIDATWGAGYTDGGVTRFTKRLSPGYFMVAPERLIQTHYPEDRKWQLLTKPLNQKTFANQAMLNIGDVKHQIVDASMQIEKTSSGKRFVKFKFKTPPKYLALSNRKSKSISFTKRMEGDYVILEFSSSSAKKVIVWGGHSRKKMTWMAMYKA